MQLTNEWIEKGRTEGLEKGQRDLVRRQLRRQLGQAAEEWAARIDPLSNAQVEALADAVLDFHLPDDARRWFAENA